MQRFRTAAWFRLILVTVTTIPASGVPALGGAWTLGKGETSIESYLSRYGADRDFDGRGNVRRKPNGGKYGEVREEVKVEYGLTNDVNLLAYLPWKWAKYEDVNMACRNRGLVDMRLGAKWRLYDNSDDHNDRVLSVSVLGGFPMGYRSHECPPLGDAQASVEGRVLYGETFFREKVNYKGPDGNMVERSRDRLFVGAEVGYRCRFGGLADQLVYFGQSGLLLGNGISIQGEVDGVYALPGSGRDREDYTVLRLGPVYHSWATARPVLRARDWMVGLFVGKTILGRNTAVGHEVVLKVILFF